MIQLTDKHWAVEVPDDAQDFLIQPHYVRNAIDERDQGKLVWFDHRGAANWKVIPHPYFDFLFTTQAATEEDARKVVEVEDGYEGYKEYYDNGPWIHEKAVNSLQSLLKSKGCDTSKNQAIIQNIKNE